MAGFRDSARFYTIDGRRLPSVTTILEVINKPALGPWYAKQERQAFEEAMLRVASRGELIRSAELLDAVTLAVQGVKAADREKTRAAGIGTAAHAKIEWHQRRMLGDDPGPEPTVPDAAELAVMSWQDWAKSVEYRPVWVERTVACEDCGYAGTADWLGYVRDRLTLGDFKTSKAVYPEAYLQNIAYRHAWARAEKVEVPAGLILRLPKALEDPEFEAVPVPESVDLEDFLAALRLWRWARTMEGKSIGS